MKFSIQYDLIISGILLGGVSFFFLKKEIKRVKEDGELMFNLWLIKLFGFILMSVLLIFMGLFKIV